MQQEINLEAILNHIRRPCIVWASQHSTWSEDLRLELKCSHMPEVFWVTKKAPQNIVAWRNTCFYFLKPFSDLSSCCGLGDAASSRWWRMTLNIIARPQYGYMQFSCHKALNPHRAVMSDTRCQKIPQWGGPQCLSTLQASACIHNSFVSLVTANHKTKARVL